MAVFLLACAEPAPAPPSVLVVVLDTVRADRLSAYGHTRPTSPRLAELAQSGVLFRDVSAPDNWTWPTHASIFTGKPPWVHGAHFGDLEGSTHFTWGPAATAMRSDLPTLAERFVVAGYRTGFLTANGVIAPDIASSLLRGFEVRRHIRGDRNTVPDVEEFLRSGGAQPAFLFVNLAGAHGPYATHGQAFVREEAARVRDLPKDLLAPYLLPGRTGITFYGTGGEGTASPARDILEGRAALPLAIVPLLRAAYDSEVAEVDAVLGEIVARVRSDAREWIIAVTADHGEYLGERGLVDHTAFLYRGVLRVPLVLSAPRRLPAGRVVEAPVELQDLYGTLLALALGADEPGSLLPLLDGAPARMPVRAEARPRSDAESARGRHHYRSCRWGDEVVVIALGAATEYYDLASDPDMERDLATDRAERAATRGAECAGSFGDASDEAGEVVAVPDALRAELMELGYIEPTSEREGEPAAP